jgi:hypothetical protein
VLVVDTKIYIILFVTSRVWNYNEEAGFSQVLHLDVPPALVPGTEQGMLLVAGKIYS